MDSLARFFLKLSPAVIPTRRGWPIALVLVVGIALSIVAFRLVESLETEREIKDFEQIAIERIGHLENSLEEAVVDKVHSIRALFAASNFVDRKEFKMFVSNLDRHGTTIQAFEWIPRVPESSRAGYEKAAQTEGSPGFRFTERERQGRMIRAGSRAEYFPVYYVEPMKGNEAAFGFDLGSNPTRLKAMRKARDSGGLVATERITLVQEESKQFGFLVFLPVYGSGKVPATVAMRRKTLTGFVLGVYRIAGIVRSSLPQHDKKGLGVEIYVFDTSAPPGMQLLYPESATVQSPEELNLPNSLTRTLPVADRDWKVVIAPAGGVLSNEHPWRPWAALAAGLLFTALLTAYLVLSLIRRFRMEEIEGSLRKSRNSMLKAQEVANFGSAEWDLESGKQVWSDELFRIFGLKSRGDESKEKSFADMIHPEDKKFVLSSISRVIEHGESLESEFRIVTPDGMTRYVFGQAERVMDSTGKPGLWVATVQDITERKLAELKTQESEQRFRDFAESAADWFWEMDEELRFTYMSPNVERILGVKPEWHYGKTREELLGENYDKEFWKAHLEDLQAHRPFKDFTYLRVGEDVWPRWLTTSGAPIFGREGKFKGYRGSANDITKRKQAEQGLRESEEQIRLLLDSTAEAIFGTDLQGICVFLNPSCVKMLGYDTQEDLLGKNMHELTHHTRADGSPFPQKECPIGKHIREGKAYHSDQESFFRADGTSFPVECWAHPIVNNNELRGAMVTFFDITERKHAQAQVIQASKLATLGEMATSVAHELNQPLNVISMAAGNLARRQKKGSITPEYLQEKLTRITSQTERAAAIIDHMRMFGRKAAEKPTAIHLRDSIFGAIDMMGEQLRLLGIQITTNIPESCPPVLGHQVQVEQVLLNLLANARDAIKAQPADHPKKISIAGDLLEDGRIAISIRDTGGGIPESVLERVFEPFFTTKEVGQGTGLGLSVSYGIISDMGGTIEVENTEEGAQFTLKLPIHSQESSRL